MVHFFIFRDQNTLSFVFFNFRALGVESPRGEASGFRFILGPILERILVGFGMHFWPFGGQQVIKRSSTIDAKIGIEKGRLRGPTQSIQDPVVYVQTITFL